MSNEKCPQGGCSGEGEYTTQGSQNEDLALNEATTHSSRRINRTIQPERCIQPTRKCKQQRNPLLENKSNDGISNHHSVPEPIAAPAQPGEFPSKVRIQWPRGNQSSAWARLDQELSATLTMRLKGSTAKQLSAFCKIVHSLCLEKFGKEVKRKKSDGLKQPNRRQVKKGQLRARQRQLKRQLKDAPQQEKIRIQVLLDDIRQEILVLSRAENHRKRRKKKRKNRESFYRNPYAFAKKLFTAAKSGQLDIPQQELEDHLRTTYSGPMKKVPLPPMDGIPPLEEPETPFRAGGLLFEAPGVYSQSPHLQRPRAEWYLLQALQELPNCPGTARLPSTKSLAERIRRTRMVPGWWGLDTQGGELHLSGLLSPNLSPQRRRQDFLQSIRQANDIIPPPEQVHQHVSPEGWHPSLEHAQMIWNSLMTAKSEKKELHVVWLDLANAYGSVPHNCIRFALKFFHIPEKVAAILMQYFGNVFMRFTTTNYTMGWQALEVGIMMGCIVSPLLFVMCMELILRGTTDTASGEETRSGGALPPSRAFMDDVTTLVQSKAGTQELLDRRPLRMGTDEGQAKEESKYFPCPWDHLWHPFLHRWQHHPTVREQPVKSLGRLYAFPLTDRHRGVEVQWTALEGLHTIEKSELPGKLKAWCFQHGLLPRLLWPLQIYKISLSWVETIQQHINKYLRKWLGVPPCFLTVGLYTATGMLQLPFSSITEEFKVGKARLHLMLRDSPDDVICQVQPEVRTGTKWSAAKAVQEAEASLQIKEVNGVTQTGRAGLGSTPHRWFSREDSRGRRDMIITGDRGREESGHCCWPSQAVRMDELGGSWGQETVMVFPYDYGTPRPVLSSPFHLQPTSHPC